MQSKLLNAEMLMYLPTLLSMSTSKQSAAVCMALCIAYAAALVV
jgi:hypothetical protein